MFTENGQYSAEVEAVCTCCHCNFIREHCVLFSEHNYDFTHDVVSQALSDELHYQSQYICRSCRRSLHSGEGSTPSMLKFAVANTVNLISIPCVCTCCHQMCSRSCCLIFKESNYNLKNDTVSKALNAKYRFQSTGDSEYICKSFHQKLKTSKNKDPQMPKYTVANMHGNASLYQK